MLGRTVRAYARFVDFWLGGGGDGSFQGNGRNGLLLVLAVGGLWLAGSKAAAGTDVSRSKQVHLKAF